MDKYTLSKCPINKNYTHYGINGVDFCYINSQYNGLLFLKALNLLTMLYDLGFKKIWLVDGICLSIMCEIDTIHVSVYICISSDKKCDIVSIDKVIDYLKDNYPEIFPMQKFITYFDYIHKNI